MPQTSANVIAGQDARASDFNKVVADLAEIYAGGPGIPTGGVCWFWSDNTVPLNYKVVDGSVVSDGASPLNGLTTPNLVNRFIRGVANANIRVSPVSGGEDSHVITIAEIPSHNHPGSVSDTEGNHTHSYTRTSQRLTKIQNPSDNTEGVGDIYTASNTSGAGAHAHNLSIAAQGGGNALSLIPSYRGLVPIMRIK